VPEVGSVMGVGNREVMRGKVPGKGWGHLAPVTTVPATHAAGCY
jgi:hypothetical protein